MLFFMFIISMNWTVIPPNNARGCCITSYFPSFNQWCDWSHSRSRSGARVHRFKRTARSVNHTDTDQPELALALALLGYSTWRVMHLLETCVSCDTRAACVAPSVMSTRNHDWSPSQSTHMMIKCRENALIAYFLVIWELTKRTFSKCHNASSHCIIKISGMH